MSTGMAPSYTFDLAAALIKDRQREARGRADVVAVRRAQRATARR